MSSERTLSRNGAESSGFIMTDCVARVKFSIKRLDGSVKKGLVVNKDIVLTEDAKDIRFESKHL